MKKLLAALVLSLILFPAGRAGAEGIILIEGFEVPTTETTYHSELGFSFIYDESVLTVDESMSEDGQSLIIYPPESNLPIYLEIMTSESIGVLPMDYLEDNAEADTEYFYDRTETGHILTGFRRGDGFILEGFYTITSDDDFVAIFMSSPEEGFGERFLHLMKTVRFDSDPPVWGQITEEVLPEWLTCTVSEDEYALNILFSTSETVQSFQILSLDFPNISDDGVIDFPGEVVYELPELTPEQPLCAAISFPGDIPSTGIAYTTSDGTECRFTVGLSGMDGALDISRY